eukprot:m51a1_g8522 hypothetical protein (447) ;mRNA; f:114252-116107
MRRRGPAQQQQRQQQQRGEPRAHSVVGPLVVDDWHRGGAGGACEGRVLTHFHSDHYGGLGRSWPPGLPIYATPETCALAAARLGVDPAALRPLPLRCPLLLPASRCALTLLPAAHCPGAAMLAELAEAAAEGLELLVLDDTFGSLQYDFPPQAEALEEAARIAREACRACPRTLVAVGMYTVGKERVVEAVARALGVRAHVDARRHETLRLAGADLALYTRDEAETCVRAVGMQQLSRAWLQAQRAGGRWERVVALHPSGWAWPKCRPPARLHAVRSAGPQALVYEVPYSEHCSLAELQEFVRWLRPARLVLHGGPGNAQLLLQAPPPSPRPQRTLLDFCRQPPGASPAPPAAAVPSPAPLGPPEHGGAATDGDAEEHEAIWISSDGEQSDDDADVVDLDALAGPEEGEQLLGAAPAKKQRRSEPEAGQTRITAFFSPAAQARAKI